MTKNSYFKTPLLTKAQKEKDASSVQLRQPGNKTTPNKQSGISLHSQLLMTFLPIVLMPLIIGSIMLYKIQQQNSEAQIQPQLQQQALLVGKVAQDVLEEEFKLPAMVATNPLVINAASRGSRKVETSNLQELPLEQVEQSFSATKLLYPNQDLNDYLRRTANIGQLAQLYFTEKHGFNVAYTIAPYDFFQGDEQWWQEGKNRQWWVSAPDFDPSVRLFSINLVHAIADPQSGEFLGVVKAILPASKFDQIAGYLHQINIQGSQVVQLVDSSTGRVIATATAEGASSTRKVKGRDAVVSVSKTLVQAFQDPKLNLDKVMSDLQKQYSLQQLTFNRFNSVTNENEPSASFLYQDRYYTLKTISRINWVAVASIDNAELRSTSRQPMSFFVLTSLALGVLIIAILLRLARQVAIPIVNLASVSEQIKKGNFDVVAQPVGNRETQILAQNLNNIVIKVKNLRQQKTKQKVIQQETLKLFSELIAKINKSIAKNESATRQLADQVLQQTTQITEMISSVESTHFSLATVAEKTKIATQIAHTASATTATKGETIAQTVEHIYQLRATISSTVQKVKQLGEFSQEIVQVIAPINQIAMQTNVLAINANLEAAQIDAKYPGLTTVAEEVGVLAERLATVKTEIEQIVDNIQWKTSEVMEAMEQEISYIVAGTNSVEQTQQEIKQIGELSQQLEELVQSIAHETTNQTQTSQSLNQLKEEMILVAEGTANSSRAVANAWQKTFALAKQLQVSIETFKIGDKT